MTIVSNGTAAISHLAISVILSKVIVALVSFSTIAFWTSVPRDIDFLIIIRLINLAALIFATIISALLIKRFLSYPSRQKVAFISSAIMFIFLGILAAYSINMYFNYGGTGSLFEMVKIDALHRTIGGLVTTLAFYFISKKIL